MSALRLRTPPDFSRGKVTDTISTVIDRCQNFCTLAVPPNPKQAKKTLFGLEVLKYKYAELEEVMKLEGDAAAAKLEPGNIEDLRNYWWLNDPAWKPLIETAEALLRLKHGVSEKTSSAASVPAAGGGSGSSSDGGPPLKKAKTSSKSEQGKLARATSIRDKVLAAF